MRLWLNSVRYALNGLAFAYRSERNMRIHAVFALIAVLLTVLLDISAVEALLVFVALVLVLMSELVNTAIEKTLDAVKPEHHPLAKVAKDCAAAAVLLCAILAVIAGIVIFGSHIWEGPTWRWSSKL